MKNKAKKAAVKDTKAGTGKTVKRSSKKSASKAKTKTPNTSKTKASPKAAATTRTKGKVNKAKVAAKGTGRKSRNKKRMAANTGTKKAAVQRPQETPVIVHGPDQHFIPSHETGAQMPQTDKKMEEQIRRNREQTIMNQENQKAKAGMAARGGIKKVFRILGK